MNPTCPKDNLKGKYIQHIGEYGYQIPVFGCLNKHVFYDSCSLISDCFTRILWN